MRLTAPQERILRQIVATNGGGVAEFRLHHPTLKVLIREGMVQGKKGSQWNVVHTRDGLDWVKRKDFKL